MWTACLLAASIAFVPPEHRASFKPWEHPTCWALELRSRRYPIKLSYTLGSDTAMAERVLVMLETSWRWQVDELGFLPPFPHNSDGDGFYPVYLMRGAGTGVQSGGPLNRTDVPWAAHTSYMTVDAWGHYAGDALESTIQHEFQHALQAAYDWDEPGSIFEMSANFMQEKARPGDNGDFHLELRDFQSSPELPPHHFNDYANYFMYGSSLYLFFVEQRYFPTAGPAFLRQIWSGARSRPGETRPDWIDSLTAMLPAGTSYSDTVVEFARWRYYTGRRTRPALWPLAYAPAVEDEVAVQDTHSAADTRLLGTRYIRIPRPAPGGATETRIRFAGSPLVRWVIQALPGLDGASDGETLAVSQGQARFSHGSLPERVLAITAVPLDGTSPLDTPEATYPFEIELLP